jgi:hypothetical protein
MSTTTVDMPKVTQMLDAGWLVRIYKGPLGSYEVRARHPKASVMRRTHARLCEAMMKNTEFLLVTKHTAPQAVKLHDYHDGWLMTDDFSPQQALTRMAYKVHGEII